MRARPEWEKSGLQRLCDWQGSLRALDFLLQCDFLSSGCFKKKGEGGIFSFSPGSFIVEAKDGSNLIGRCKRCQESPEISFFFLYSCVCVCAIYSFINVLCGVLQ